MSTSKKMTPEEMETAYWIMKGEMRDLTEQLKKLTLSAQSSEAKGEDQIAIKDIKVST